MDCKKDCKKLNIKNFIMGRWFPLILALLIIGLIFTVGFLFGFRITYAPELKNDWEAISGVATWAEVIVAIISVIASFMAVWYAIQVPQKIAERQDRIALFEKRFECYSVILNLIECAKWIETRTENREIAISFRVNFDLESKYQIEKYRENYLGFTMHFDNLQVILIGGEFLFTNYNIDMLQKIIDIGLQLLYETWPTNPEEEEKEISESAMKLKIKFCKACQEYKNTYLDKMSEELKLTEVE